MSTPSPQQLLFLPGASGNTAFWEPVAARLELPVQRTEHVGWPGLGPTPADPSVSTLTDLVPRVAHRVDRPTALIAQSMGCVVAALVALEKPALVTHLVLAAMSGGIDLARHGAVDWRTPRDPGLAPDPFHLFSGYDRDLTPLLRSIQVPVLLLWGDSDPLSPVSAGEWLLGVLPQARLHVVRGGTHVCCSDRASEVAPLIHAHLAKDGAGSAGLAAAAGEAGR